MGGRLEGKGSPGSGAARGQGRSHEVNLASARAGIIAFDVREPVRAQGAPPVTEARPAETIRSVEIIERRVLAAKIDARDHQAVSDFVRGSVAELGRPDAVVANAGINGPGVKVTQTRFGDWQSVIETNLTGVFSTVSAALPAHELGEHRVRVSTIHPNGAGKRRSTSQGLWCSSPATRPAISRDR
jgi:(+)-trans-carveol dehydrogenase